MTENESHDTISDAQDDQARFAEYLKHASETVKSWPAWKQAVLGVVVTVAPGASGGDLNAHHAPDAAYKQREN